MARMWHAVSYQRPANARHTGSDLQLLVSGRGDSNPRPPAPKAGALPTALLPGSSSTSDRTRWYRGRPLGWRSSLTIEPALRRDRGRRYGPAIGAGQGAGARRACAAEGRCGPVPPGQSGRVPPGARSPSERCFFGRARGFRLRSRGFFASNRDQMQGLHPDPGAIRSRATKSRHRTQIRVEYGRERPNPGTAPFPVEYWHEPNVACEITSWAFANRYDRLNHCYFGGPQRR